MTKYLWKNVNITIIGSKAVKDAAIPKVLQEGSFGI